MEGKKIQQPKENSAGSAHNQHDEINPNTFTCDFCLEPNHLQDSFKVKGCTHFYCDQCIVKFVVSKLQDNVTSIMCPVPGCQGTLDPEHCRRILPNHVFDRWGMPYVKLWLWGLRLTTECPHCKRDLCPSCKVPWHAGFDCAQFQKLSDGDQDQMVEELAKEMNWMRCPSCKSYIEKSYGCNVMKCRCGRAFFYKSRPHSNSYYDKIRLMLEESFVYIVGAIVFLEELEQSLYEYLHT
ncbi:ATP-dependent RNA helicase DEAH12 chloroplastic [Prunus yedoensis var. nudiflora]|uniref:RBR-type E3 ubiquitin transferase n=1 Tax=Prunus yedoensis var. nudiflora TaxID=2094558 RepID=A0A314YK09_PRUYE|nr:ATP-dependent RNA helicase DEAH12 chloroplastic [Prunus yedoensis var. nudiflora]